jgi:hypothetical protein
MAHKFLFSSIARTIQVRLTKGADVDALKSLDQKYWLMLSCPVQGLGEGETIGRLLDSDKDGRVNVTDVLAAVDWLRPRLKNFDVLFNSATGLSAEDINATTTEGGVLASTLQRLASEGVLTAATMDNAITAFYAQLNNGDGVVPSTAAGEAWTSVGEAILAVTGGASALDGSRGVDKATLKQFLEARDAYVAWKANAPKEMDFPASIDAASATAAVKAIVDKVEAYFVACDMVRYNPAAKTTFDAPTEISQLSAAPICLPHETAYTLPFEYGINPTDLANMAIVAKLAKTINPDAEALDIALWSRVKAMIEPFANWVAAKPAHADFFAAMSDAQWTMMMDAAAYTAFEQAIDLDAAQAPLASALDDLRRLVILRVDFLRFLRNFVNVEDLYPPTARALFQVGTLYMDGRSCTLCFPIAQAATAHAAMAKDASCCLAYCTLSRPAEKKTQTICVVFTAGTAKTLSVGRNGLFYDLKGEPWDATITHLVPASLGLLEAFFAPWIKMAEVFKSVVVKFISTKNDVATSTMTDKAEKAATTATTGEKTPPEPPKDPSASMASIATLGIALSFFATAITGIIAALTNAPLLKTAMVVFGFICMVSLPNVILTWFKLRARNLASILNASGWAVNRCIGLTPPLGRYFTQETNYVGKRFIPASLPKSKKCGKKFFIFIIVLVAAVLAWYYYCPTSPRQKAAAAREAELKEQAAREAERKAQAACEAEQQAQVAATIKEETPLQPQPAESVESATQPSPTTEKGE